MRKSILYKITIILVCFLCINNVIANSSYNSIRAIYIPKDITELDKLTENESLSATYREELKRLKEKIDNDMILEQEEIDFIRQCKIDIIKGKLGEERFIRYCKLIEKKHSNAEFTQEDRYELYEIEKLLN